MATKKPPEVWLRGPLENIPPLLQPVAHAILQAGEELNELMKGFPDEKLWTKPAGVASPGFHLQHLTGVMDRLFTYARGTSLSEAQLAYLKAEGDPDQSKTTAAELVQAFHKQAGLALQELKQKDQQTLTEFRAVGRAQLPSTVMGLLFHAAEHTMRHLGQLIVTVRIIKGEANEPLVS